ncbi:unnamed protein product [Cylindrotheca closterium]|uniref:LITAF domain-containing protein n=1 Tax=Cylindrotheca closterium TaxID=2856 RepID=A0AAD2CK36_9STRA|nr:unnamed protein product [Cylindrotheca closterium]
MTTTPPKKMINVNGIMRLNPEYNKWKKMQDDSGGGGGQVAPSAPPEAEMAAADASGVPMVAAAYIHDSDQMQYPAATTGAAPGYSAPSPVVVAHSNQHEPMSTVPAPNNNGTQGYSSPVNHGYSSTVAQQTPTHTPNQATGQRPPQYLGKFGSRPFDITCPNCHRQGLTRTDVVISTGTIVAIILLLFFFWPLFWLPLVMTDCKQVDHYCPHCRVKVGEKPSSCCS